MSFLIGRLRTDAVTSQANIPVAVDDLMIGYKTRK